MLTEPLYWLIAGAILMAAELIIPGGIVFFLGLAAAAVSASLWLGIIDTWVMAFTAWFVLSIVLLFGFQNVGQRFIGGDSHLDDDDEDAHIFGQTAIVTTTIGPAQHVGRVECMGSSWAAVSDGSVIEAGQQVKVIKRENIGLLVTTLDKFQS